MRRKKHNERGSSLIEFALAGILLIFFLISLFQMCLAMWSYETLAFAVREGARYAATKGQGCSYAGNSCSITVAAVAQQIATSAIGLSPSQLNVTLSASGGTSVTCNPLNTCYSNSTQWPPSSGNVENSSTVTVTGNYPETVMFMLIFGIVKTSSGNLQASSQQTIQF